MTRRLPRLAALFLLLPISLAAARAEDAGKLAVSEVRAPPSLAGARNGVAYFTLHNDGTATDRLMAVDTPIAERAELHWDQVENGVMRMRPVSEVTVEPGQTVTLRPGGEHVMLIGLRQPLKPGETFPLTLTFAKAGRVVVTASVATDSPAVHQHGS